MFRHPALAYLRAFVSANFKVALRMRLATALSLGLALAALIPPTAALPRLAALAHDVSLAWYYFCSMLLGAAPFLTAGAVAAAAAASATPTLAMTLPLFALLFPGCDCSINAYATQLRCERPSVAAFAVVWGSCCNPLALFSTATILGPHLLCSRLIAGTIAATLTALAWARLPVAKVTHACQERVDFWESFLGFARGGIASFAVAACVSSAFMALFAKAPPAHGFAGAALLGALLSPCSSADPLLARVLFRDPATELTFIVASQCLDVRQVMLVRRCFGTAHALRAAAAAVLACVAGSVYAAR
ncbi:MAG TPA: hypothetical protein VGQ96_00690 [Candidatus Eremiobacteraceae bacterium]|nr:hypothetical protein [Candidatus Eremiobacteraceae bacterium]